MTKRWQHAWVWMFVATLIAGCTLTDGGTLSDLDLRRAQLGAQIAASSLCDIVDDAASAATVTEALRAARLAMDVEGDPAAGATMLSAAAHLTTGQALATLDGLALLLTYVPMHATPTQGVEIVGAGVARCLFVIESKFPPSA